MLKCLLCSNFTHLGSILNLFYFLPKVKRKESGNEKRRDFHVHVQVMEEKEQVWLSRDIKGIRLERAQRTGHMGEELKD